MLTTKDAIEKRRSIRSYKADPVSDEIIQKLIESAHLAPSGSNSQPWRFKIVKDKNTRERIADASHKQKFISQAPVIIVCCADIEGYLEGTVSGLKDLGKNNDVEDRIVDIISNSVETVSGADVEDFKPKIAFNVAIAVEHVVLRALDFGLGTCWIRLFEEEKVKEIFGWNENIYVVALLPLGYPAENPSSRSRLSIKDIILD